MNREIKIGERIRDNDPRMGNRVLEVIAINGKGRAVCRNWAGRRFFIGLHRIYTDGKARRSGFSLTDATL